MVRRRSAMGMMAIVAAAAVRAAIAAGREVDFGRRRRRIVVVTVLAGLAGKAPRSSPLNIVPLVHHRMTAGGIARLAVAVAAIVLVVVAGRRLVHGMAVRVVGMAAGVLGRAVRLRLSGRVVAAWIRAVTVAGPIAVAGRAIM